MFRRPALTAGFASARQTISVWQNAIQLVRMSVWQSAVQGLETEVNHGNRSQGRRLNFRLPADLKEVIEEAAASLGQSVTDFAVTTLVQQARSVIEQQNLTRLSDRDRDCFIALLDNAEARPNAALAKAAKRYKKSLG